MLLSGLSQCQTRNPFGLSLSRPAFFLLFAVPNSKSLRAFSFTACLLSPFRSAEFEIPSGFLFHGFRRMELSANRPVCRQPVCFRPLPHCSMLTCILPLYFGDCNHKNKSNQSAHAVEKNVVHIKGAKRAQQLKQFYTCHKQKHRWQKNKIIFLFRKCQGV